MSDDTTMPVGFPEPPLPPSSSDGAETTNGQSTTIPQPREPLRGFDNKCRLRLFNCLDKLQRSVAASGTAVDKAQTEVRQCSERVDEVKRDIERTRAQRVSDARNESSADGGDGGAGVSLGQKRPRDDTGESKLPPQPSRGKGLLAGLLASGAGRGRGRGGRAAAVSGQSTPIPVQSANRTVPNLMGVMAGVLEQNRAADNTESAVKQRQMHERALIREEDEQIAGHVAQLHKKQEQLQALVAQLKSNEERLASGEQLLVDVLHGEAVWHTAKCIPVRGHSNVLTSGDDGSDPTGEEEGASSSTVGGDMEVFFRPVCHNDKTRQIVDDRVDAAVELWRSKRRAALAFIAECCGEVPRKTSA